MRIIWDSSNLLVEEYIRGCLLVSERVQYEAYLFTLPDHSYTDCHDYTHPGYSALSQATQLLFNDICNEYIHVWHSTTAIAVTYRGLILILLRFSR